MVQAPTTSHFHVSVVRSVFPLPFQRDFQRFFIDLTPTVGNPYRDNGFM